MSDLQSTLDAIDQIAVHQCGWCQLPLNDNGPSPDFCNDICQTSWTQQKQEIIELVDYNEPSDLPQHYSNQRELSNPQTTPRRQLQIHILRRLPCTCTMCSHPAVPPAAEIYVPVEPDLSEFRRAMTGVGQRIAAMAGIPASLLGLPIARERDLTVRPGRQFGRTAYIDEAFGLPVRGEYRDELQETPQERALRLRRTRNTGPQPRTRAPRRINARRTR